MYDLHAICIFQWWEDHPVPPLLNCIDMSRTFSHLLKYKFKNILPCLSKNTTTFNLKWKLFFKDSIQPELSFQELCTTSSLLKPYAFYILHSQQFLFNRHWAVMNLILQCHGEFCFFCTNLGNFFNTDFAEAFLSASLCS